MSTRRTISYVVDIDTTAHDPDNVTKVLEAELRLAFGASLRKVSAVLNRPADLDEAGR